MEQDHKYRHLVRQQQRKLVREIVWILSLFLFMSSSSDLAAAAARLGFDGAGSLSLGGGGLGSGGSSLGGESHGAMLVDPVGSSELELVSLFEARTPVGLDFCGGLIGKSGKAFCTNMVAVGFNHCGVVSHGKAKADLEVGGLFICRPVGKGAGRGGAFVAPSLSAIEVPDSIRTILEDKRPFELWVQVFDSIKEGNTDVEQVAQAAEPVSYQKTPFLKRIRPEDPAIAGTATPITKKRPPMKVDVMALPGHPGRGHAAGFGVEPVEVEQELEAIVAAIAILQDGIKRIDDAMHVLTESTSDALGDADLRTASLKSSLGNPPKTDAGLEAAQVWPNLVDLSARCSATQEELTDMGAKVDKHAVEGMERTNAFARQCTNLQNRMMASDERVDNIHSVTGALYTRTAGEHHSSGEVNIWACLNNLDRRLNSSAASGPSPHTDGRLDRLEEELHRMKSGAGNEVVYIEHRPYHSPEEIEEWVVDNIGAYAPAYLWFDLVSMLESARDVGVSSGEAIVNQGSAKKGGYEDLAQARVLGSFSTTVPSVFNPSGKGSDDMSAINKYEQFDPNDSHTGLVNTLTFRLQIWEEQQRRAVSLAFPPATKGSAYVLATSLISRSRACWIELSNWMAEFYRRQGRFALALGQGGGSSAKEVEETQATMQTSAWRLVKTVLRDIFDEIATRRAAGASANSARSEPMKCSIALYAALRAHKFMRELSAKGVERHPSMAPTFNSFLFHERAPNEAVHRLERRVNETHAALTKLTSQVDKLVSNRNSGRNTGGGGRGYGGGQQGGRGRGSGAPASGAEN